MPMVAVNDSTVDTQSQADYGPVVAKIGANNYDPYAVLEQIRTFFANLKPGDRLSEYATFYIMYLMSQYGNQVVGVDANMQGGMNSYFNEVQDLWNQLNSSQNAGNDPTTYNQFETDLANIRNQVLNDPFFKDPSRQGGANSILSTLDAIQNGINAAIATDPSVANPLNYIWQQYNTSSKVLGTNPQPMNTLTQQLGQLNQLISGQSQTLQALTQNDVQMNQTENQTMNNYLKAIIQLVRYLTEAERTG